MKQSKKLEKQHEQLRSQIVAEILLSLKQHQDIEIEPEINVFYASGIDEQDEPLNIQEVGVINVGVFHQGEVVEYIDYVRLTTEKLLEILDAMEKSYAAAKKFAEGS